MALYGESAYGGGPVVHLGSDELRKRYVTGILTGKKHFCLAITKPRAG